MPIHLGTLGGLAANGIPNPISNLRVENTQIIKAYWLSTFREEFLVYDTETTGTTFPAPSSAGIEGATAAFNHLINDRNCIMAILITTGNDLNSVFNNQPLQPHNGSTHKTHRQMGFPLLIDRMRLSATQIAFNRSSALGGSFRDNWVNNYSNTSMFVTNFGSIPFSTLEARQQDIPSQGLGRSFVRWNSNNISIDRNRVSSLQSIVGFTSFRGAILNDPCIIYIANNGYRLIS